MHVIKLAKVGTSKNEGTRVGNLLRHLKRKHPDEAKIVEMELIEIGKTKPKSQERKKLINMCNANIIDPIRDVTDIRQISAPEPRVLEAGIRIRITGYSFRKDLETEKKNCWNHFYIRG